MTFVILHVQLTFFMISLTGESVTDSPQELLQVVSKGAVHESVDERVGHVVEEVKVEEDDVEGDDLKPGQP